MVIGKLEATSGCFNGDETPANFIEPFRQCLAILADWSYGPELGPDLFCLEEA